MSNFSVQQPNLDLVNWLSAYFTRRNEPNFSLAKTIDTYLALPGLVGFWPLSTMGSSSTNTTNSPDISSKGLHLTRDGSSVIVNENLFGATDFSAATDYFFHADAVAFDITGTETNIDSTINGLTIGAWVKFDALGSQEAIANKYNPSTNQRSYYLYKSSTNFPSFLVSVDGTATAGLSGSTAIVADTWSFVCGAFDPSTSIDVWLNDVKNSVTSSIPASIFDSDTQFRIARRSDGTDQFSGRQTFVFLCKAYLSDAIIGNLFQQTRGIFGV